MKNIIYTYMIFSALLYSCTDDSLDVVPRNELNAEVFWQSENDADLALAGAYRGWESSNNMVFLDAITDLGYDQHDMGFQNMGNGQINASNYIQGGWADQYSTNWFSYSRIYRYNTFLENIENIEMDAKKKERYIAEMRFLRAYDYFNKALYFGDVPLITKVGPPEDEPARISVTEIKQFVLDELTAILQDLPVQNNIVSGGHVTRGAALALKARLQLYMGKYAEAMLDAKAVIDMGVYDLYPDYRELFLQKSSNTESILDIQFLENGVYTNRLPLYNLPLTEFGWSALSPTQKMVDVYEMSNGKTIDDPTSNYDPQNPYVNRDPRLDMTIVRPGQMWNGRYFNSIDQSSPDYFTNVDTSPLGMNVIKHVEPLPIGAKLDDNGVNVMVIRLAEVYLIYAEGALETNTDIDYGLSLINEIRLRAGQIPATELTEELVRRERIVELAFEGLRHFDLIRWDLGPEVMNGPIYGVRFGSMDELTGKITWEGDEDNRIEGETRAFFPDRNYLLPIPQSELDANSKMTQNPGY